VVVSLGFLAELIVTSWVAPQDSKELSKGFGQIAPVAKQLFSTYLLPFEVTSVILLAAIVGAVVLAQRKREK
jgi:NADH-quinone oxidoreductase subunit J